MCEGIRPMDLKLRFSKLFIIDRPFDSGVKVDSNGGSMWQASNREGGIWVCSFMDNLAIVWLCWSNYGLYVVLELIWDIQNICVIVEVDNEK